MNIAEFNKKIDKLIADIPKWQKGVTDRIALTNLASLITKRVVETGVNEKGGSFSGYSTKPTLAGASTFTTKGAFNKVAGVLQIYFYDNKKALQKCKALVVNFKMVINMELKYNKKPTSNKI